MKLTRCGTLLAEPPLQLISVLDWTPSTMTPTRPAFIEHGGEADLAYVSNGEEWELDPDLSAWPYSPKDRLIDSEGWEYRLLFLGVPKQGRVIPDATGVRLASAQMSALVERHLLSTGHSVDDYRGHMEKRFHEEGTLAIVEYLRDHS